MKTHTQTINVNKNFIPVYETTHQVMKLHPCMKLGTYMPMYEVRCMPIFKARCIPVFKARYIPMYEARYIPMY
jgi:hypothetical protein